VVVGVCRPPEAMELDRQVFEPGSVIRGLPHRYRISPEKSTSVEINSLSAIMFLVPLSPPLRRGDACDLMGVPDQRLEAADGSLGVAATWVWCYPGPA